MTSNPSLRSSCTSHGVIAPVSIPIRASAPACRRTKTQSVLEPWGTGPAKVCGQHCPRRRSPSSSAKRPTRQSKSSMNLRRCESPDNPARIAALSADQAPTAIIGCPHMTMPCLSNKTALAMVFKLAEGAQKSWRRLDCHNQLPQIIEGVKFIDWLEVAAKPADLRPIPPRPDPSGRHQKSAIAPPAARRLPPCTVRSRISFNSRHWASESCLRGPKRDRDGFWLRRTAPGLATRCPSGRKDPALSRTDSPQEGTA